MEKALIAMSGGVDSAVAALLTQRQGYACVGCTMRLYDGPEESTCCSLEDVEDARAVARRLEMPFHVFNFTDGFRRQVMEPFAESYRRGMTPNPCIECNRAMKFGALLRRAEELGCRFLVTGHYARIEFDGERYHLKKAADPDKDQTYVLYMLTQDQLSRLRFPLGEMTKARTRRLAEENGFVNADKPDSQDICFAPDGDYAAVIERLTGEALTPGNFVDREGRVLGPHKGLERYTVGQRRGLGIALGEPAYVLALRPEDGSVVLGPDEALYARSVRVSAFHWIAGRAPESPIRAKAKIRYRHREKECTVTPLPDGGALLEFDEPQRAATPGQSAVVYDGDEVLGGGVIVS